MVESNGIHRPVDASSSPAKGVAFELLVKKHFADKGDDAVQLDRPFGVLVGFSEKKEREFDLGTEHPPILIECKAHSWTRTGKVPMGKLQAWNEAMLYFSRAPNKYRKILCVGRAYNDERNETLGEYYVKTFRHLIPPDVSVMEFDGPSAKVLHTTPIG